MQSTSTPHPLPIQPVPYTTFTSKQKRLITILLGLSMLASPLTATIYLPLLPLLATRFHVSLQAVNLTITLYIVFQALSPLLFATLSDSAGRRPVYLTTYTLYTVASLGLALNKHSYAALLVLRALQSLGASAVLAIAYGVIADISVPAERGKLQGPIMGAANLAVCVGPVVGGWVALGSGGFEWVFWCLVIFGGTMVLALGWGFPETARSVVGNGSLQVRGWRRTWWNTVGEWIVNKKSRTEEQDNGKSGNELKGNDPAEEQCDAARKPGIKVTNPLTCLRIIFWKDTALVLWMAASPYAVYYCIQTSIPPIYKNIYNFDELQVGLSYLPGGAGVVLGSYANGKLMDWNYRATAKQIGHTIDRVSGDDLATFPIERARARGSWCVLLVYISALIGYGWAVREKVHESIPLIIQFVLGVTCTSFQQTFNALLVDIFPNSPSTAATSANITRCALSACAVAVAQPLIDAMGFGWFFTLLGFLSGGGGAITVWAIQTFGMDWRRARAAKTLDPGGGGGGGGNVVDLESR